MKVLNLDELKKRDFFEKENYFVKNKNIRSIIKYGQHTRYPPFLTIIVPTFNRPQMLKECINSILNQEGFDDYQILVVDNDDFLIDEISESEKIIRFFNDSKIIYYRNEKNIGGAANWNRCIELAKSEWLCMVHDDDILLKGHLSNMVNIIRGNKKIDFLTCGHKEMDFIHYPELQLNSITPDITGKFNLSKIQKLSYKDYNFGFKGLLLGAIFRRQCALELGGFGINKTSMEDWIFTAKFSYYYNLYRCSANLYGYRWQTNDSLNVNIWNEITIVEYYLFRYISNKRMFFQRWFYCFLSKIKIVKRLDSRNNGHKYLPCGAMDVATIYEACEISIEQAQIILFINKFLKQNFLKKKECR